MGKRDAAAVSYFRDNERYADLINVYLFHGKGVVRPEDLREQKDREVGILPPVYEAAFENSKLRKPPEGLYIQKYRDSVRKVALGTVFVVIGLEHQDKIHYAMPVQVMMKDAAGYDEQVRMIRKEHRRRKDLQDAEFLGGFSRRDVISPVVTLVIYYGREPWSGPRNLKEMMAYDQLPEEIRALINDYPIHILEVKRYEETELFKTDLREVFGFIQRSEDSRAVNEYLERHRERFENLEEDAFDMIASITGSGELKNIKQMNRKEGGKIDMCEAIKQMIAAGKAEGRAEGKEEGRAEGRKEGRAEGRKEGKEEGRREGRAEGLELASAMIADGRADEVARLCSDKLFMNEMKKRYGFHRTGR